MTPTPGTPPGRGRCSHLVDYVELVRCGLPWDAEVHDPLGPLHRFIDPHPFDSVPLDPDETPTYFDEFRETLARRAATHSDERQS